MSWRRTNTDKIKLNRLSEYCKSKSRFNHITKEKRIRGTSWWARRGRQIASRRDFKKYSEKISDWLIFLTD